MWFSLILNGVVGGDFCNDTGYYPATYFSLPILFFIFVAMLITAISRGAQRKTLLFRCAIIGFVCWMLVLFVKLLIC